MTDPTWDKLTAELNRHLAEILPREARYRYFGRGQHRFLWTTEPVHDDDGRVRWQSGVYQPVGPGARSGKATRWELRHVRFHATRRGAKARALKLWKAASA